MSNTKDIGEPEHDLQKEQKTTPSKLESGTKAQDGEGEKPEEKPADPNLVTWDGPQDPANPKTWSFKRRWLVTGLVSLIAFMTPIASSMIAPAAAAIDKDLDVHTTIESELIFSIFLLSFVIGPLFLAPASEVWGRVIVLQVANIWFLIFNLVCGFAQNTGEMLAFRFLAGLGACAPQTIGGGVISDLWTAEERGTAVALYTVAPILGPSVGPIIGAWVTENSTWRWGFWAVTIFGVLVQALVYFTLEETYAPVILKRKVQKLRASTGNNLLHTAYEVTDRSFKDIIRHASTRVFVMIGTQPIVQYLALYMSITYGIIYLMLSTYPNVWTAIYHESVGIGGLNYISLAIGMTAGAQTAGQLMNFLYQRLAHRSPDGKGRPEFRVPLLFVSTILMSGGLFMYGWSAEKHTHWIVPNIGAAIFGFGTSMTFTSLQTYIIDTYEIYAASAVGATAVARSITGFGFPLFAEYMYDALGEGWGNSVLGFAVLGVGFTGSLVLWFYGKQLRARSQYAAGK